MFVNYGKSTNSIIRTTAHIEASSTILTADIIIPAPPKGIIVIVQTTHEETKNSHIVNTLIRNYYGVVIVNLLSDDEVDDCINNDSQCDINLLSERLIDVTKWIKWNFGSGSINLGFLASGKGAAAALKASLCLEEIIKVIVCREGRTDLVSDILQEVVSPTMFIVGDLNKDILKENKNAYQKLTTKEKLVITSDPFYQEGKSVEEVKEAMEWFDAYINKEICETVNSSLSVSI